MLSGNDRRAPSDDRGGVERAELRHTCHGCGASCEGQWVGPLDATIVAQLRARHAELASLYPQLAEHSPFVQGRTPRGETLMFLNFPGKRCAFLDPERRCLLHAHYGPDAKPEACRRFPALAINDGAQIRVGIRPLCYHAHREVPAAEPLDLDFVTAVAAPRPPLRLEAGAPAAALDEARYHEQMIAAWCSEPELTALELLARLAGHPARQPPRSVVSARAAAVLARAGGRLPEALAAFAGELAGTVHGAHVASLLAGLRRLAYTDGEPIVASMPAAWSALAVASVGELVRLRETSRFPTVVVGAMALAAGGLLAAGLAHDGSEPGSPEHPAAEPIDGIRGGRQPRVGEEREHPGGDEPIRRIQPSMNSGVVVELERAENASNHAGMRPLDGPDRHTRFFEALVAYNRAMLQSQAFVALFPGPDEVAELVEALVDADLVSERAG